MANETVSDRDSNGIKWLAEVEDIPSKAEGDLAKEVLRRYNGAVLWQSTEMVNGRGLRDVLENCWNQQNGLMSCADRERMEALGVDAQINLTALKVGIAQAYLTDALVSSTTALPWVVQPTPRPSISPESSEELLQQLKQGFFSAESPNGHIFFQNSNTTAKMAPS